MILTSPHPFGHTVTVDDLIARFTPLASWEERYRQLILLGKLFPALPDALKVPEIEQSGCENRVWLGCQRQADGYLHFYGDSEGRIVRGLLAVLLTAVEGKSALQIQQQDPLGLFETLGLSGQLSASRSAGLNALAAAVKRLAETV